GGSFLELLDALKPARGWSAAAGIPQAFATVESNGRTALRLAVEAGRWDVVEPLLEASCSLRSPGQDLRSPLTAALEKGHVEALLALDSLNLRQSQRQLAGQLSSALRDSERMEDLAPKLAEQFG
ncbi:unnamed protein product, partial [Effrenium voratum]